MKSDRNIKLLGFDVSIRTRSTNAKQPQHQLVEGGKFGAIAARATAQYIVVSRNGLLVASLHHKSSFTISMRTKKTTTPPTSSSASPPRYIKGSTFDYENKDLGPQS